MKKIVLIACVAKKLDKKAKAKDLYISPLFTNSLAYAQALKPDKIFILSALHHILELDRKINPYNVTLGYVPKKNRKRGLKVLNPKEKKEWGKKVIKMLSKKADLQSDKFVILAGQAYIKPIASSLKHYEDVLNGVSFFDRLSFLKRKLNGK